MIIREATPSDIPAIARVQLDSWRSAYAGLMPDHYLAEFTYAERADAWHEQLAAGEGDFVYVAEMPGGEVVGFACARPDSEPEAPYASELTSLHVRRAYHRQGLGRRLFAAAVARLKAQGVPSLWLWVLAGNPARGFYEHLGGTLVDKRTIDPGDVPTVEVAYAWPDLGALARVLTTEVD